MASKPVAAVLFTASGSLFLAGCGGDTASTTPVPAPAHSTAPAEDDVTTTSTTTRPQSLCCWSRWGGAWDCGNYPGPNGGFCNNDPTKSCGGNGDCADLDPPSTTPPPTTTTTTYKRSTTTTTTLPPGACVPQPYRGCLNGEPFMFAEKFTCGNGADVAIHSWTGHTCGAHAQVYNPHDNFVCNNEINLHHDGQCREYDPNDDPAGCRCPSSSPLSTEVTNVTEVTGGQGEDTVTIDTTDARNKPEHPCLMAEGSQSCLNGFLFDPSTDMICGSWIIKSQTTHGCCPRFDAIAPYNLQTQSCCQYGDSATIREGAHQCQCRAWPNPHCSDSQFTTV